MLINRIKIIFWETVLYIQCLRGDHKYTSWVTIYDIARARKYKERECIICGKPEQITIEEYDD